MMFFLDPEFKGLSVGSLVFSFSNFMHKLSQTFSLGKRTKISQVINKSQVVRECGYLADMKIALIVFMIKFYM